MEEREKFLGQGMKFPPQVNPATGRFETSSGKQSVKESVYLILMTQKTERISRPDFGSSLMSYTFMDTGITALNIMAREIKRDILNQEPRISDIHVNIDAETKKGCLIVNIEYQIRDSGDKDNLVFPFYLDADREEDGMEDIAGSGMGA